MRRAADERVLLGVVAGAHGVRGAVRITTFTDRAEDVAAYGPLSDAAGARRFSILSVRTAKGGVVAQFAGIDDRDAAEALKGTELYVPRSALPEPEAESWYRADLVGLAVEDRAGRSLGRVAGVHNYGAGDLLEIAFAGRRRTELVPFTKSFVPAVEPAGGRIVVDLPDGGFESGDADAADG